MLMVYCWFSVKKRVSSNQIYILIPSRSTHLIAVILTEYTSFLRVKESNPDVTTTGSLCQLIPVKHNSISV